MKKIAGMTMIFLGSHLLSVFSYLLAFGTKNFVLLLFLHIIFGVRHSNPQLANYLTIISIFKLSDMFFTFFVRPNLLQ